MLEALIDRNRFGELCTMLEFFQLLTIGTKSDPINGAPLLGGKDASAGQPLEKEVPLRNHSRFREVVQVPR